MSSQIRNQLVEALTALADPTVAVNRSRFFKSGPGEYGEGDKFRGLTVPQIRSIEKTYRKMVDLDSAVDLLASEYHEDRLLALLLMNYLFARGDQEQKTKVYEAYLANTSWINNWDLVDSSARFIIGPYIESGDRSILYELAESANLWERRIAVIATYHLIKQNDFADILRLAEILIDDRQDLIQKAVGWMLREAGKQNLAVLIGFLDKYAEKMPRTMLRYSVEKLPDGLRTDYMGRGRRSHK
ncbi:MAG: DNA alkylation repair protein [Rhodothermales bacterium]|nr:DNA alkylation repair protein [Rhodothermales bacterium]